MDLDAALAEAHAALKCGDRARAALLARSAQQTSPPAFETCNRLAQLFLELQLLDDAAQASKRAIAFNDRAPQTWRRLAIVEMQRGRLPEAREAFEHVIALSPGVPGPLNNLGVVLQQQGQYRLAIEKFEAALRINPDNPEVRSNLAAARASLGQFDEAIAQAERAIAIKPDYPSPYVHAAFAEADRGRCEESLAWLDRLPAAAAASARILTARAEILLRFERFEEAYDVVAKAIRMEPANGDAHHCMGILLSAMEREREAIVAFDRASALMQSAAIVRARKGIAMVRLGEQEAGLRLLDEAQTMEPDSAAIRYMRGVAADFRFDAQDIAAMDAMLEREAVVSATDLMHLHFTLAGAHLQAGETSKVFPHLNAGNALKRGMISYDADAEEHKLASIAAAFPGFPSAHSPHASSEGLIFIVGMPRSGTTLMEQILASHPQVCAAGELRDLDIAIRQRFAERGLAYPDGIAALEQEDYDAIGRAYLARVAEHRRGGRRLVDKMPTNALHVGIIHRALPQARIVFSRRDAFDTCLSCYSQLFTIGQHYSYDLTELGRYQKAHDALMSHWKAVLPANAFCEIEYEALVADIEGVSRGLFASCRLEWTSACMDFHKSKRPVRTASMSQVRQPLYRSSVGRWRQFAAELAPLVEILGPPPQAA